MTLERGWYLSSEGTDVGPFTTFGFPTVQALPKNWATTEGPLDVPNKCLLGGGPGGQNWVRAWFERILSGNFDRRTIEARFETGGEEAGAVFGLFEAWPVALDDADGRIGSLILRVDGGPRVVQAGALEVKAPRTAPKPRKTAAHRLAILRHQRVRRIVGQLALSARRLSPGDRHDGELARGYARSLRADSTTALERALSLLHGTPLGDVARAAARDVADPTNDLAAAARDVAQATGPLLFAEGFDAVAGELAAQALDATAAAPDFRFPLPPLGPPVTLDEAVAGTVGNLLTLVARLAPSELTGTPDLPKRFGGVLSAARSLALDAAWADGVLDALLDAEQTGATALARFPHAATWQAGWRATCLEARTTLALLLARVRDHLPFQALPSLVLLQASPATDDLVVDARALLAQVIRQNLQVNALLTARSNEKPYSFAFKPADVRGLARAMGAVDEG